MVLLVRVVVVLRVERSDDSRGTDSIPKEKTTALIPSQTVMSQTNKDLVDYIDIHHVKALNITAESNPEFLFGKYLNVIESRADPQIVLMISLLWQGR